MKYRRLFKLVLTFSVICILSGFVLGYLWDYGFSAVGITREVLAPRALEALGKGMLIGGLYIAFPIWLALDYFRQPEKRAEN